jgi:hypothetical protein
MLTSDQWQAVQQGQAVRISSPDAGAECVVVRADVYERVSAILDDSLTPEQVGLLVEQTMHEEDEGDPLLDSYQCYRP